MIQTIKDAFKSKKFLYFLVTAISLVIAKLGWDISADTIKTAVALVGTLIVGQGLADFGKEARKAEVEKVNELVGGDKASHPTSP